MDDRTAILLVGLVTVSGSLVVLIYQAIRYFRRDGNSGPDSDD